MSSSNQIASSVKWASFSKIIRILLQYITLLILVMYLSPSDFGLMSTAMIFIGFFNLIKDLGFSSALIQLEDKTDELLSSVFWLNALIGMFLSISLFFSSCLISNFYETPKLQLLLEVLSINFVFSSISALQNALFEKGMNFNVLSKIEVLSSLIASTIAITMAILNYGVWALVFQALSFSFFTLIFNWTYSDFRPKFTFKIHEIKKVLYFGINLSGFNILNYFVRNADYFLIGKYLGMSQLGFYSLAYRIMLFPMQNISSVVNRVIYPALSKVRNNNKEAQNIYINAASSVAFISFPLMIGFFVLNENIVKLFFAEKWNPIIDLLYILVPIGMIQSVYSLAGAIFLSKDRTKLWFQWGVFSAVVTVIGFYLGLSWGILGVAFSYLITNFILIYPGSKIPFNLIELKVGEYYRKFATTFVISVVMGILIYSLKYLVLAHVKDVLALSSLVFLGVIVYLGLSSIFNKEIMSKLLSKLKMTV